MKYYGIFKRTHRVFIYLGEITGGIAKPFAKLDACHSRSLVSLTCTFDTISYNLPAK